MSTSGVPRDDSETHLAAAVPGPSGTGESTDAGADPDADVTQATASEAAEEPQEPADESSRTGA